MGCFTCFTALFTCMLMARMQISIADDAEEAVGQAEPKTVYKCTFDERSLCDMRQDSEDDFDWTLTWGIGTPSKHTGPLKAHSPDFFIYIEATGKKEGDKARIITLRVLESRDYCIDFWYNMYGRDINQLNVYTQDPEGTLVQVWSKQGDQGKDWLHASVPVHMLKDDRVVFEGVRGARYRGDVALDDIAIQHCGTENTETEQENTETEENNTETEQENTEIEQETTETGQENTKAEQKNTETVQENTEMGQKKPETEQENTESGQKNTESEQETVQENTEMGQKKPETELENTETGQKNTETEQKNTETRQEKTEAEQENAETKQENTETGQEKTEAEQEKIDTKQENSETGQEKPKTEQEGTEIGEQNTETEQENTELGQENTETGQENTGTEQENNEMGQKEHGINSDYIDFNF